MTGRTDRDAEARGNAKDVVLARIHAALADGPAPVTIPRDYDLALAGGTDRIDLFIRRVDDYRATVRRTTADGLGATIATVLRAREARRIAVPAGVPDAWLAAAAVVAVADEPVLSFADLDGLDGVITGCAVGIAETGTIILDGGLAQGRRALSLLPDLHLCIVMASQVVGSVPEALARLSPVRPQTWISGPSATSDIELQRVEGVHGPRILEVVLVDD